MFVTHTTFAKKLTTLQGDILQEYYMNENPVDGLRLCYFDGKLLATVNDDDQPVEHDEDVGPGVIYVSVMALAGA